MACVHRVEVIWQAGDAAPDPIAGESDTALPPLAPDARFVENLKAIRVRAASLAN